MSRLGFVSLEDESETGHGGGADDRDGGGHGKAVGLGGGGARVLVAAVARGDDGCGGCDGLSAGLVGVGAGVGRNALAGGVCRVRIPALQADVGGGSELNDGVGRCGADVSGAADGVQLRVDIHIGRGRNDGSENGDEGSSQSSVGRSLDVCNNNASAISGGRGDCVGGGSGAAAVGLVVAVIRVAVCEDRGGKAEDEAVLDLHVEGWRLFLGGG